MLSKHLQLDFCKVHLLLNWYNLMAILLQEVEKQLCELTSEGSDGEDDKEGSDGEDDEGKEGDEDYNDGSPGPFVYTV